MGTDSWTLPSLLVVAVHPADENTARALSGWLGASGQLRLITRDESGEQQNSAGNRPTGLPQPWRLLVDGEHRTIVRPDGARCGAEFTDAATRRRTAALGPGGEPLLRALGIAPLTRKLERPLDLVDTTAGFGSDSWLAASVGCRVHMLERSALMVELLTQALVRARALSAAAETAARITLQFADATDWLQQASAPAADVIYLDPMFPLRRKSAKVGKGMQFLHELLPDTSASEANGSLETAPQAAGPDSTADDTIALLRAALDKAAHRVVVKRPRGAPRLEQARNGGEQRWTGQVTTIDSPGLRYDVYHLPRSDADSRAG